MTDHHEPLTEAELQAIQDRCDHETSGDPAAILATMDCRELLAEVRRLQRELEAQTAFSNVVTEQRDRKYAELERLRAENAKLSAGWASVDTTKLKDIIDLDDCKRRLQREREHSHGAIRELCDLANTPAGAYKERLDAANAELAKLRALAEVAESWSVAKLEARKLTADDDTHMDGWALAYAAQLGREDKLLDALAALGGTDADRS